MTKPTNRTVSTLRTTLTMRTATACLPLALLAAAGAARADANVDDPGGYAPAPAAIERTIRIGAPIAEVEADLAGYNLLERVAMTGPDGRVDYIVVRTGAAGAEPGLVFVNGTLRRIVAADDRKAFAACRTLATSRGAHWMGAGIAPFEPILAARDAAEAREVRFVPPAAGSLGQAIGDGAGRGIGSIESLVALVPTSLNPAAIPRAVRSLVKSAKDEAQAAQRIEVLKRMPVGMSETALVGEIGVDWARVEGVTPLLWYRKESFEVIMKEGRVAGVEFPARQERIAKAAGGYYEPGVDWSRCAPIAR